MLALKIQLPLTFSLIRITKRVQNKVKCIKQKKDHKQSGVNYKSQNVRQS